MKTVNIHEAKIQLSRLIEQAVKGDSFIIAKAGKPLVKVTRLDAPLAGQIRRLGFMEGRSPLLMISTAWALRKSSCFLAMKNETSSARFTQAL